MSDYKTMTVTELDRLYWELYGKMRQNRDRKSYRDYCEIGGAIMKELESRGIKTLDDIVYAKKQERV